MGRTAPGCVLCALAGPRPATILGFRRSPRPRGGSERRSPRGARRRERPSGRLVGSKNAGRIPRSHIRCRSRGRSRRIPPARDLGGGFRWSRGSSVRSRGRSEEHTSELQSPCNLVCRLLLEKKKKKIKGIQDEQ